MLYKVIIWLKSLSVDGRSYSRMINLFPHSSVSSNPYANEKIFHFITHIEVSAFVSLYTIDGSRSVDSLNSLQVYTDPVLCYKLIRMRENHEWPFVRNEQLAGGSLCFWERWPTKLQLLSSSFLHHDSIHASCCCLITLATRLAPPLPARL